MLKNTFLWRKNFNSDLEKVVFNNGFDKEGRLVCYNVYGEFQDKELYNKTLLAASDDEMV
ncbi:putative CRAL-TRIO lipid binding domain superfamily [Helianthus annuus]|nr:putative CRAL-TRIO lipid binding domain superfamily [Helianthus annuus]